ncbi:MAG TPA: T9SS type A sorting domain-containing protein, partial [Candidatus Marinimicrobia bacterium]|nr:T9SS type A sorting domain-containing protein [Candidatus Neomarinimicrobiota bacterium]
RSWNASVILKSGTTYTETTIVLDSQNSGGISIGSSFDTAILIPNIYETTHSRSDLTKFPYEYGFSSDTTSPSIATVLSASDVSSDQGHIIELSWTASLDDTTGGSINSYDILRSTSAGTGFTLAGSVTPNASAAYTTNNTVPLNKTNYYYKIRARDKWYNYETAGEIEFGPVVAIDDLPPGPPINVNAVDTFKDEGGSIDVTWNISADDGKGANDVLQYTIFRSTDTTVPFQTTGIANAGKIIFYDTPVINGTDYYYYVRAEDGNPNYSYSDTTGPAQAKDDFTPPPTDFKAVGIDDRIELSWINPTVPDFVNIFIIRKNESPHPTKRTDGLDIHAGTDSTWSDKNNIVVGQSYYYSAISYDTAGNESDVDDGTRAQAAITLKAFNYPNPTFSGQTTIRYQLENTSGVEAVLYIFDIAGELVLKIENVVFSVNNIQPVTGTPVYDYSWDGKNGRGDQVASGIYIFIIEAKDNLSKKDRTGKIAVIK